MRLAPWLRPKRPSRSLLRERPANKQAGASRIPRPTARQGSRGRVERGLGELRRGEGTVCLGIPRLPRPEEKGGPRAREAPLSLSAPSRSHLFPSPLSATLSVSLPSLPRLLLRPKAKVACRVSVAHCISCRVLCMALHQYILCRVTPRYAMVCCAVMFSGDVMS